MATHLDRGAPRGHKETGRTERLMLFTVSNLQREGTVFFPDLENSMDCIVHGVAKSWT